MILMRFVETSVYTPLDSHTLAVADKVHLKLLTKYKKCFYRPYWRCYYSNTDAIIYVVDSADRDRIGISKQELVSMLGVKIKSISCFMKT